MHGRRPYAAASRRPGRKSAAFLPTINAMRTARAVLFGLCAVATVGVAGCASRPVTVPAGVFVGVGGAMPAPPVAANGAAPHLRMMQFSSLVARRGERWSGRFVTSTNVASVEVRTNLFSIDVPRTEPGRFAFTLDVLDVPPIFIRSYRLRVIARNSAGIELERDLPFEIR
jgi:hypothetical protein